MLYKIKSKQFVTIITLLFVSMQFFSFAPAHKYYFSLTEIKVNTYTKTMAVSSKLFIDDLEFALQKANNTKYDLTKSAENKAVNAALFNYMNSHLQIYIAGKIVPLSLVGFETENEVVWIYLESKINNKEFVDTKIVNSLLYDFSSEQTNMIQFKWNNKSQAEKLVYPNKELIIKR